MVDFQETIYQIRVVVAQSLDSVLLHIEGQTTKTRPRCVSQTDYEHLALHCG